MHRFSSRKAFSTFDYNFESEFIHCGVLKDLSYRCTRLETIPCPPETPEYQIIRYGMELNPKICPTKRLMTLMNHESRFPLLYRRTVSQDLPTQMRDVFKVSVVW